MYELYSVLILPLTSNSFENKKKGTDEMKQLFIAYHGTYEKEGSLEKARELFYFLQSRGVDCYFFPNQGSGGYFADTPIKVKESAKFLFVCNPNVATNPDGSVSCNGVVQEITTFWNCMYERKRERGDAKVYAYGGLHSAEANELHIMFQGVTHFDESRYTEEECFEQIYAWVMNIDADATRSNTADREMQSPVIQSTSLEVQTVYIRRSLMNEAWNLRSMISVADKIECLGISNHEMTTRMDERLLVDALNRGTQIELLFLDPKGKYTRFRENEEHLKKNVIKNNTNASLDYALRIRDVEVSSDARENLGIFIYDQVPRMNMIFLDGMHLLLQFYSNDVPGANNPCFYIKRLAQGQLYDFYYSQYEKIRNSGKRI